MFLFLTALMWNSPAELAEAQRLADARQERAAIATYERIAAAEAPRTPAFWLNLGKLNERAGDDLAALRAYRMVPHCTDLPSAEWWLNLQAVRRKLAGADSEAPPLKRLRTVLAPWALRSVTPAAILFSVFLVFAGPLALAMDIGPPRWRPRAQLAFLAAAFGLLGCLLLWILALPPELDHLDRPWVIVKPPTPPREGNGASYPAAAPEPVRPGAEGRLTARRPNGWLRVELDDGRTGWLPEAAVLVGPKEDR